MDYCSHTAQYGSLLKGSLQGTSLVAAHWVVPAELGKCSYEAAAISLVVRAINRDQRTCTHYAYYGRTPWSLVQKRLLSGDVSPTMRAVMEGPIVSKTLATATGCCCCFTPQHFHPSTTVCYILRLTQAKSHWPEAGALGCQCKCRGTAHLSSQHGMQAGMKCFGKRPHLRQATPHSTSTFRTSPRKGAQDRREWCTATVLPTHGLGASHQQSSTALPMPRGSCDHKMQGGNTKWPARQNKRGLSHP